MIKRKHTKTYKLKIRFNRLEFSTATGIYLTMYDVRVPFLMPEFSSSKIISHRFNVDNNEGELGISYDMIIGYDLIVKLGLSSKFKHQFLQWYGATVTTK